MSVKIIIDGVDKTSSIHLQQPISDTRIVNERSTAQFTCKLDYLPAKKKEVYIYQPNNTDVRFGGIITNRALKGWEPVEQRFIVTITCGDFLTYLDGCFITLPAYTSTSVLDILTAFVAALPASYGITLSGSQIAGPNLTLDAVTDVKASDYLRQLATTTQGMSGGNLAVRMSPLKVLDMFIPGTASAPVAMTESAVHAEATSWKDSTKPSATKVILKCGGNGTLPTSQDITSAGVSQNDYVTDYPAYLGTDLQWPSLLIVNGSNQGPVGFGVSATGWYWDAPNHKLVNTHAGGAFEPGAGDVVTIGYTIQYPFTVTSDSGGTPEVQYRQNADTITTIAAGQQFADGLLAQLSRDPRIFSVQTKVAGFDIGQALSVDLPTSRQISSKTFFITSFTTSNAREGNLVYNFDAEEQDTVDAVLQGSTLNDWRNLLSGASSSGVGGGGGGSSPVVIATNVFIGGSRNELTVMAASADWRFIVNYVPWTATFSGLARVRADVWARNGGSPTFVGVTIDLWDNTASGVVGTSSEVTSPTPIATSFTGTVVIGNVYIVRVKGTTNGNGQPCGCIGYLEAA